MPVAADDLDGLVAFARGERIDFVVVGPEAPLVAGLVDRLEAAGIKAFGPTAAAAALEGSKGFMKDLCARHAIPTPRYGRFTTPGGRQGLSPPAGAPIVVKADGLAAGKGVVVAATVDEAQAAIDDMMLSRRFGAAGASVVIEEFLEGEEALLRLCDGEHRAAAGLARRTTSGSATAIPARTPAAWAPIRRRRWRRQRSSAASWTRSSCPRWRRMKAEGRPFQGRAVRGLMLTAEGPKLIEYNVRFGDPECQVLCCG